MSKKMGLFILCNSIFLLYLILFYTAINSFLLGVAINMIIFLVPGYVWFSIPGKDKTRDPVSVIFYSVSISILVMLSGVAIHRILNIRPTVLSQLIYLIIITNIAFLSAITPVTKIKFNTPLKNYQSVGIIVSLLVYILMYVSAIYIVPPQECFDISLQGSAYGLINTLKPYKLTTRRTYFTFAHPLLQSFNVAATMLFSGQLEGVKYYYNNALLSQKIKEQERIDGLLEEQQQQFFKRPCIFGTRISSVFFSSLSCFVLFYLLFYLTDSVSKSSLASLICFTFLPMYVHLPVDTYKALAIFGMLSMSYFYIRHKNRLSSEAMPYKIPLFLSGIFCGLTEHKISILVLAIFLDQIIEKRDAANMIKRWLRAMVNPAILGYALGYLCFCIYGMAIEAKTFIFDHFQIHFIDRIIHQVRLADLTKASDYFTLRELWLGFIKRVGWPFVLLFLSLIIYRIKDIKNKMGKGRIYLLWLLVWAIAFSIVDWRLINHLIYIIPPLVIIVFSLLPPLDSRINIWARAGIIVILALTLTRNLILDIHSSLNFYGPTYCWKEW